MPEVISMTVYRLNELHEGAKDRARAWYREAGFDHDWYDAVYEDFQRIAEILGIQLKTRTTRVGDYYEVTGQKVWTSRALHSDLMLLIARTTPLAEVKKKTEGLSVFLVDIKANLGHGVYAAPQDNHILLGITYELLAELAAGGHVQFQIRPVAETLVRVADEIWLSSSTKEVVAVTTLDGKPVGAGVPGPVFKRMHALFQDFKAKLAA